MSNPLQEFMMRLFPTPDWLQPGEVRPSVQQSPLHPAPLRQRGTRNGSTVRDERWYRDALHRKVGGSVEVALPDGDRIDILTAGEVIEVKAARHWKSALGQVLAYSAHFPQNSRRIHLFGPLPAMGLAEIQRRCAAHGVHVTHAP